MIELTPAERRRLKARAHPLQPVVMIGDKGLTEAVLRAIDAQLTSHELIKVKVAGDDRAGRKSVLADICAAVGASPVQHIGAILVLYRENPLSPAPPASARTGPARAKSTRRSGSAPRTGPSARRVRPSR